MRKIEHSKKVVALRVGLDSTCPWGQRALTELAFDIYRELGYRASCSSTHWIDGLTAIARTESHRSIFLRAESWGKLRWGFLAPEGSFQFAEELLAELIRLAKVDFSVEVLWEDDDSEIRALDPEQLASPDAFMTFPGRWEEHSARQLLWELPKMADARREKDRQRE